MIEKLLVHTRRPDITFCRNGIIRITATLARALSLLPGDIIKNGFTNSTEKKTMTIDTYPDCVYFIYKNVHTFSEPTYSNVQHRVQVQSSVIHVLRIWRL